MTTWTTKSGKVMNISDMTVAHIRNTLAMLRNRTGLVEIRFFDGEQFVTMFEDTNHYIKIFEDELSKRTTE